MMLEAIGTAGMGAFGLWGLRALAHRAILNGLRAPRVPHADGPMDVGLDAGCARELRLPGPGGRQLFAWFVTPAAARDQTPAVLAMHGWGANGAMLWPIVPPLRAAGFAVLLLDARCHGRSDDEAFTSMPRFAEDIAAGLAWLRAQPQVDAHRVALLGHSVGAAAALLHASRHRDVCAVMSLSAFAHPREVMRRWLQEKRVPYPVLGWYVLRHVEQVIGATFDAIAPLNTLPQVRCPVLLVHGRDDATVPFADAQRLHAVAHDATLLPVAGDHDLRDTLQPHAGELVDFLCGACRQTEDARHPATAVEVRRRRRTRAAASLS